MQLVQITFVKSEEVTCQPVLDSFTPSLFMIMITSTDVINNRNLIYLLKYGQDQKLPSHTVRGFSRRYFIAAVSPVTINCVINRQTNSPVHCEEVVSMRRLLPAWPFVIKLSPSSTSSQKTHQPHRNQTRMRAASCEPLLPLQGWLRFHQIRKMSWPQRNKLYHRGSTNWPRQEVIQYC